jgi:hypothetical protein
LPGKCIRWSVAIEPATRTDMPRRLPVEPETARLGP